VKKLLIVLLVPMLAALVACGDSGNDNSDTTGAGNESTVDASADCTEGDEVETDSGLKIEDLKCGDGDEAEGNSVVRVHYVGMLENGTEFDSSRDGDPVSFALGVGQLIPGFEEGIRGMKVGGLRKLTIPPELGYGEQGIPGTIPPDSTLVFEIELFEVQEPPAG
jgi:FKBP-type peptidyl-prolyl cis-trans isomerase FkpA